MSNFWQISTFNQINMIFNHFTKVYQQVTVYTQLHMHNPYKHTIDTTFPQLLSLEVLYITF